MVSSAPEPRPAPEPPAFERLLKRDDAITLVGLLALCVLAWIYIVSGAGLGMSAWQMTTLALFPHLHPDPMALMSMGPESTLVAWLLLIAMWWTMMIAMMVPSAAPAILLYAQVHRHGVVQGRIVGSPAPTGAFALGYLLAWLLFSGAATALQRVLEGAGVVSAMMMGSQSRWLSAAVLILAGLYQLTPIKQACLSHCRSPTAFLTRHWRPHAAGALRLGVLHGAYCVGCCWMLMALLFVGGVMNLVWIAALGALALVEKVLPAGAAVSRGIGVLLLAWGVATVLV